MSRPTKVKEPKGDFLADEDLSLFRQLRIDQLRVDPLNDDPLSCVLASTILGRATDIEKQFVGELFAKVLATSTPEQLALFFHRINRMKASVTQPHRNAFAYFAYSNFITDTGREPSKNELRKYIEARPDVYRDQPSAGDGKGWTRLWEDSGLFKLSSR